MPTRTGILARLALPVLLLAVALSATEATAQTIARCGRGFLEEIDGYLVLHVKGTPYEMGFQHGALLKDHIRANQHYLFEVKGKEAEFDMLGAKLGAKQVIGAIVSVQRRHIPPRFVEEMEGLAAGAEFPVQDALIANFIPELFHCSGFAVMNSATKDGTLYHGRVLDYATDWRLQEHAVLVVAEPEGGIPFVNVTYAGFVGSVTGMNAAHVSIGEMGGRGLSHWDGTPMAFLVRRVLEEAQTLDDAVAIFRDSRRTCEYYYVVADGKDNRAVGLAAHWNAFEMVRPGEAHPLLPEPVEDAVLLSAGDRYCELVRRVREQRGKLDAQGALRLMDRPVAMKSNLHCVLFEPRSTRLWVANASPDGQPAATQRYY
ncbi:MAG: peptidase C45, partial [Planctomycetes bacterium]|nr:peptidase C45 [Planctomycetota bacterium]